MAIVNATVIVNPVSGRRAGAQRASFRREVIDRVARRAGVSATMVVTEGRGHATTLARAAAEAGVAVVVAWGGDGTVNEVAAGLAGTTSAMSIVPAGSGNGLARTLGMPWSPESALAVAFTRETTVVDLGELNGRIFVNVAGIGFDAAVARVFNAERTGGWGLPRYIAIALREARHYEPQTYRIAADGVPFDARAYVVAVANSAQYGNGARIAPRARMDDGQLDMVIVGVAPVWRMVLEARRLFDGSVADVPQVQTRTVREAEVTCQVPMALHVDGEPLEAATQAVVRIRPGALNVVRPV